MLCDNLPVVGWGGELVVQGKDREILKEARGLGDPKADSHPMVMLTGCTPVFLGFSGGSDGKESTCNAGDPGSTPGSVLL